VQLGVVGAQSFDFTQPSKQVAVYETTYAGFSQKGVIAPQDTTVASQLAWSPSTQRANFAQQPTLPQPHVPGSWNTE
jgi:hypothetical protein